MSHEADNPLDALWAEYTTVFQEFDDLTLARWMAQTLGQLQGRGVRLSHPLVAAYRLAGRVAHDRQVWLKKLANYPPAYAEAPCCRAPLLPLLTRDVAESGLVCLHCNETAVPFDELPEDLHPLIRGWAEEYAPVHAIAHLDEQEQKRHANYDDDFETAAEKAETLLAFAGHQIVNKLIELYPTVIWEDQDECLEVRPEDVQL